MITQQKDYIVVDNQKHYITNVTYTDNCYIEGNIFGSAVAKTLEFTLNSLEVDLYQKQLTYYTQLNENEEPVLMGSFFVLELKEKDTFFNQEVFCIDYMLKLDTTYNTTLNFEDNTVTIKDMFNEILNYAELETETPEFPNCNFVVDSNQFESNETWRQVLIAIAQISGRIAKITKDNKLNLISLKSDDIKRTITTEQFFEIEKKRKTNGINTVIIGNSQVEGENITQKVAENQSTDNTIAIMDNPIAYTQEKRAQLIPELFEELKGFTYQAFKIKYQGLPLLNIGDPIEITNIKGDILKTYVLRYTYKSPKGLDSELSAPSIIKAKVEYQTTPSKISKLLHSEIKVDKAIGEITSTIEEINESTENKLTEIKQTINDINLKVETIGGANLIADSVLFGYRGELDNGWSDEENSDGEISSLSIYTPFSISGHAFKLNNKKIIHTIKGLDIKAPYSFSVRVFKDLVGGGYINIYEKVEELKNLITSLEILPNKSYEYTMIKTEAIKINSPELIIEYVANQDATITFTDNILNLGSKCILWTVALGEIMGVNTQFNNKGMYMVKEGEGYTKSIEITPQGMLGKYNNKNIFELSEDKTISEKFIAKNQIEMGVIKIIPINTGSNKGWVFVDIGGN